MSTIEQPLPNQEIDKSFATPKSLLSPFLGGVLLHSSGSELQNESITKAQKQARRMRSVTFDDPISRVRNIMIVAITVRSLLSTAFKNPKFVSRLTFPRMSRSLFCLSDERGMHFATQDGQLIYVRTHSIDK